MYIRRDTHSRSWQADEMLGVRLAEGRCAAELYPGGIVAMRERWR
jgi:hypothetical protein